MAWCNHVWGEADLKGRSFADAVLDYAKQFTPPHRASRAVGHIKRAVQSGLEMGFHDGLALERELQQRLFESADAQEGIRANLEKRQPRCSPKERSDGRHGATTNRSRARGRTRWGMASPMRQWRRATRPGSTTCRRRSSTWPSAQCMSS